MAVAAAPVVCPFSVFTAFCAAFNPIAAALLPIPWRAEATPMAPIVPAKVCACAEIPHRNRQKMAMARFIAGKLSCPDTFLSMDLTVNADQLLTSRCKMN